MFGFPIETMLKFWFWGLFCSLVGLFDHCMNQFVFMEYFATFQTLLEEFSKNCQNFHISGKFCLGVKTYKVTSRYPYHNPIVKTTGIRKCFFWITKGPANPCTHHDITLKLLHLMNI